ncbi:MAG: HAMP domain-containing sensor histidine kinase, partial [Bacteroidota bacterium]
ADMAEEKSRIQRNLLLAFGIAALMLVTLLGVVYWNFLKRKKLVRDVSEKNKELEVLNKQLSANKAELIEINSAKDKFFSILEHDLKGPLKSLSGFTHLLSNFSGDLSREEIRNTSENLDKSVKEVKEFLESLLTWSRAQMNAITIDPEPLLVEDVVRKSFSLLRSQAEAKKVQLINEVEPKTSVYADQNAFSTVIRNLVSNAVKFSYKGAYVRVLSEQIGDEVLIHIIDTGVGISEDALKEVFRVDVRHSTTGTDNEKGTGLGLVICKELVEQSHGKIKVESQKGRGTTFSVRLPSSAEAFERLA